MGKATRWFKGLLGMNKDKQNVGMLNSSEKRDKKRWSFRRKSSKESTDCQHRRFSRIPGFFRSFADERHEDDEHGRYADVSIHAERGAGERYRVRSALRGHLVLMSDLDDSSSRTIVLFPRYPVFLHTVVAVGAHDNFAFIRNLFDTHQVSFSQRSLHCIEPSQIRESSWDLMGISSGLQWNQSAMTATKAVQALSPAARSLR
ncbi:hypothetical protein T459_13665 [Capsicum annuum]|uniref:Uncharacterized protein n=1 Tax=Capsicum annuum TaxID=4072 RepID=A0A2G2ZF76_CAPAN|nr:hypothetical protein T459_13665 [Capsicum annuum]